MITIVYVAVGVAILWALTFLSVLMGMALRDKIREERAKTVKAAREASTAEVEARVKAAEEARASVILGNIDSYNGTGVGQRRV